MTVLNMTLPWAGNYIVMIIIIIFCSLFENASSAILSKLLLSTKIQCLEATMINMKLIL